MKVTLCQMEIAWEDKEKNFQKAEKYIKLASEQNSDVIFLPEMSLTGFSMNVDKTSECNNETVNMMIALAEKYCIAIGIGWVKKRNEKGENHYTIIDKDGNIVSDYAKIHPFSYAKEDQFFESGEKLVSFQLNEMRCSNFICYDLRFPEVFQAVSNNVEMIVVPANWPKARREHWKCLLKARAIENQVYMVGINCVGNIGGLEYSGDSCIISPNGIVLDSFSEKEGIISCVIENDVQLIRDSFRIKDDRKVELYKNIL